MNKVSGVYKITNEITGDFYIGSSKNVFSRYASHRSPSTWKNHPNSKLYKDFQKYGLDKFKFQILYLVKPEHLKQTEQEFIEMLHPAYNNYSARGRDVERWKEAERRYNQSERGKETHIKAYRKYNRSDKGKESRRKYRQSKKDTIRKNYNQLCSYMGETLTLNALSSRFSRQGIPHPTQEAKKYLLDE